MNKKEQMIKDLEWVSKSCDRDIRKAQEKLNKAEKLKEFVTKQIEELKGEIDVSAAS